MKRKSTFTLVVALMMLLAFTASCFAATTTTKPVAKPAVKPAVKTPVKKAVKPAVKPAVKAAVPAAAAAAAIKAPATLTGDKAKAYVLLAGCKYSGKADGKYKAMMIDVPILGDVDMAATTSTTGVASKESCTGVPGSVGGDFKDRKLAGVPFTELTGGKASDLEAFLKGAATVTVTGNKIVVTKVQPPASIIAVLNNVAPGKVLWTKKDMTMNCTINVAAAKVTSISIDDMTGTCKAPLGKLKGKVSGTVTF